MEKVFAVMVEGKQTPSQVHHTYEGARVEAERLAKKEQRTTYILQAVAKVEIEIKVTPLEFVI